MAYEYETEYFELAYFLDEEPGILDKYPMPVDPNPESLYKDPLYIAIMRRRGEENWELVTVTPLLRACYHIGHQLGYPLTAGYYFFWRRQVN
jgi:hypothetical protein